MNNKSEKFNQFQEKPKKEFELDYEPFDPEIELKKLRKFDEEASPRLVGLGPKTRAERLKNYKEELIKQKQGIAEIQIDLEKEIRTNPDISQKALMNILLSVAPKHRLSEKQLDLFKQTLKNYTEKHQTIKKVLEKYPDNRKLFNACFGKYPKGKIKIIESPITIYFRCYNIKDYTWILEKKFFKSADEQKLKKSEIKSAKKIGGHVVRNCLIASLNDLITVENTAEILKKISPKTKSTFKHEEQHIIKNLFEEQLLITPGAKEFIYNPSLENLTNYLRFLRRNWFESKAKSEILAYYKKEDRTFKDIKGALLKSKKKGGLYYYYDNDKEDIEKKIEKKLTPEIFKKNKQRIEKNFKQVFIDEHKQEIIKAINAIKTLKKIKKSKSEIIYLLITEPLSRWSKLAKRIKEDAA